MARRVFFSFYYDLDIFRVSQVRNSNLIRSKYEESGFIDHAEWESLERQGKPAIQKWIDNQMHGSSVTVVLIGSQTYSREWVNYEIQQSHANQKGMLGIYIHQLIDPRTKLADTKGQNPFSGLHITNSSPRKYLSEIYPTYDWANDKGYDNFASWVEKAAAAAGR